MRSVDAITALVYPGLRSPATVSFILGKVKIPLEQSAVSRYMHLNVTELQITETECERIEICIEMGHHLHFANSGGRR